MASYRHLARIAVMQTMFAYEFKSNVDPEKTLKYCIKEFYTKVEDASFAEALVKGIIKHREEILKTIQTEAPEWPIEKIAPIDRAILEIGAYEILFSDDVPPVVAINEGVEIAKSYGDTNSAKFINGVLSSIMHKYRPEKIKRKEEKEEEKEKKEPDAGKSSSPKKPQKKAVKKKK
jgi:transcription antitermination protein NusB